MTTLASFVAAAIAASARCCILGSPAGIRAIEAGLAAHGFAVEEIVARGQLVLTTSRDFLVDGRFDGRRMAEFIQQAVADALRDGFTGLWASGDVAWELGDAPDLAEWARYEAALDGILETLPIVGLCQYRVGDLSADAAICALERHGVVVTSGKVHMHNCFHARASKRDFAGMLDELRSRDSAAVQREELRRELSLEAWQRVGAALDVISGAFVMLDPDATVTFANREAARLAGCSAGAMIGEPFWARWPHDVHQPCSSAVEAAKASSSPVRFELRFELAGRCVWLEFEANATGSGIAVVYRDVGAVRRTQEATARLAAIVESSADAIIGCSLDGTITSWNRGAVQLYGYSQEEAVGSSIASIIPGALWDDERQRLAAIARGEAVASYETKRRRKDGALVDVFITSSAVRDASGNVIGIAKIARDVTAQRRMEAALRLSRERLAQAQRLEAVGRLAGGIAHDFNNLLCVILTHAELLAAELHEHEAMRADALEIGRAGVRGAELTQQLLAFSRQQVLELRALNLADVLADSERMFRRVVGEDILITTRTASDLGNTLADRGQMEQVIMNLVVNARDAMVKGGSLNISLDNFDVSTGAHPVLPAGRYVRLTVADTGAGMDDATRARIFEPFFTTKERGRGTGLGLATVFGIVDQSGGYIDVESVVGQGTTFRIYLPRTDERAVREAGSEVHYSPGKGETILLVDDDAHVRSAAAESLRRHGYRVLEADDPKQAILLADEHAKAIQLLVTDVVMPGVSGIELAEELRRRVKRELNVLLLSGYAGPMIANHGVDPERIPFLQKPFSAGTLAAKVRAVLDAPTPCRDPGSSQRPRGRSAIDSHRRDDTGHGSGGSDGARPGRRSSSASDAPHGGM